MKHLLITGSNGQLGNEVRLQLDRSENKSIFTPIYTDVDTLDITSEERVEEFFRTHKVDFVVNCAAYTAVDKAESEKELCYKINTEAVKILAKSAIKHSAKLIQISTDYVFDGNGHRPYTEDHPTAASSVYGQSKVDSERFLQENMAESSLIIRTSWLYSKFGNNFVKTMIRLGSERENLNVVFDQIGTPTSATDLAKAIITILKADEFVGGIYHFSNEGVCSWYDFATSIMQAKGLKCSVSPILSKGYPTPAPRPHFSVLDKAKIKATYGVQIPHWHESMLRVIAEL